ncbi:Calmodulin [Holothuria leucospilota]|uniref:Calmodulin n=1 Tax=Holothuria leucospilota TaxID=206669 RepID=A0A9Q1HCW6_HOLLE|nr:Calmodulin [Holothuria leucospilota]
MDTELGQLHERLYEFKEAFQMFDKDKDGVIKVDELEMVMKLLDQNMTKKEVRDMFNEADADGNGSIDFNEFLSMMAQKMTKHDIQDEMKQAFRVFDSDQTGCLSSDDIRHIMTTYGETLTKEEVDEMLAVADVNRNGQIPYMDYIKEVASALHDLH